MVQRLEYASRSAKRRMVRYVVLVLDLSAGMSDHDLRPNRFTVFRSLVEQLIDTFFDQNPVSQLGAPALKRVLLVLRGRPAHLGDQRRALVPRHDHACSTGRGLGGNAGGP